MSREGQKDGVPCLGSPQGSAVPLTCLSWNSARKRVMRSEGMAKEIPAATLSVLMPMTSPSWAGPSEDGHPGARVPSTASAPRSQGRPAITAPSGEAPRAAPSCPRKALWGSPPGQGTPPPLPPKPPLLPPAQGARGLPLKLPTEDSPHPAAA